MADILMLHDISRAFSGDVSCYVLRSNGHAHLFFNGFQPVYQYSIQNIYTLLWYFASRYSFFRTYNVHTQFKTNTLMFVLKTNYCLFQYFLVLTNSLYYIDVWFGCKYWIAHTFTKFKMFKFVIGFAGAYSIQLVFGMNYKSDLFDFILYRYDLSLDSDIWKRLSVRHQHLTLTTFLE